MKEKIYKIIALILIFSIIAIIVVYLGYSAIKEFQISIIRLKVDLIGIGAGFLLFIILSLLQLIVELIDKNDRDKKNNQTGNDYDNKSGL
mgnify:CR=1 FL=1